MSFDNSYFFFGVIQICLIMKNKRLKWSAVTPIKRSVKQKLMERHLKGSWKDLYGILVRTKGSKLKVDDC